MAHGGWSKLPTDLLTLIIEQLPTADRARFKSVCTAWSCAHPPLYVPLEPPCLLFSSSVPEAGSSSGGEQKSNQWKQQCQWPLPQQIIYSISDDRTYKLSGHQKNILADCCAIVSYSPDGWLMYMDKVCELRCLHLPSGQRIHPPSITTFCQVKGVEIDPEGRIIGYYIDNDDGSGTNLYHCNKIKWLYSRGIILFRGSPPDHVPTTGYDLFSTDDSDQGYVIVVVYNCYEQLAFARQGDPSWTMMTIDVPLVSNGDLSLHNGSLYVASRNGKNVFCIKVNLDLSLGSSTALPCNFNFLSSESDNFCTSIAYVVGIDGHLWLIRREVHTIRVQPEQESEESEEVEEDEDDDCDSDSVSYMSKTLRFQVYSFEESQAKWVEKNTIGDYAIFVGNSYSLALSTHEFPQLTRDCIYFTDDNNEGYDCPTWDLGVYNLQDQKVSPYYDGPISMGLPQPIWVMPLSFYNL